MGLERLPTEVLYYICNELPAQDVCALRATSQNLASVLTGVLWGSVQIGEWRKPIANSVRHHRKQEHRNLRLVLKCADDVSAWLMASCKEFAVIHELRINMESVAMNDKLSDSLCSVFTGMRAKNLRRVLLYDPTMEWLLDNENRPKLIGELAEFVGKADNVSLSFIGHTHSLTFKCIQRMHLPLRQRLSVLELTIWRESVPQLVDLFTCLLDVKSLEAFEMCVDGLVGTVQVDTRLSDTGDKELLRSLVGFWLSRQTQLCRFRCDYMMLSQIISVAMMPANLSDLSLEYISGEYNRPERQWFQPDFLDEVGQIPVDQAAFNLAGTSLGNDDLSSVLPKQARTQRPWDAAVTLRLARLRLAWKMGLDLNTDFLTPYVHRVPFTSLTHLTVLGFIPDGFDVAVFRANSGLREVIIQTVSNSGIRALTENCPNLKVFVILSFLQRSRGGSLTSNRLRLLSESCSHLEHLYVNVGDEPDMRIIDLGTAKTLSQNCPGLAEIYIQPGGGYNVTGYYSPYAWIGPDCDDHLSPSEFNDVSVHLSKLLIPTRPETLWYNDVLAQEPMIRRWLLKVDVDYLRALSTSYPK